MPEDYELGRQIGQLQAQNEDLRKLIESQNASMLEMVGKLDKRVKIIETWMQTTIGKITVITFIFGVIGSLVYTLASLVIKHINFK